MVEQPAVFLTSVWLCVSSRSAALQPAEHVFVVGNRAEVQRKDLRDSLFLHAIKSNYRRDRPVGRVIYDWPHVSPTGTHSGPDVAHGPYFAHVCCGWTKQKHVKSVIALMSAICSCTHKGMVEYDYRSTLSRHNTFEDGSFVLSELKLFANCSLEQIPLKAEPSMVSSLLHYVPSVAASAFSSFRLSLMTVNGNQ